MKNFVHKKTRRLCIWIEKKYAIFTDIKNKPDAKKTIYPRLANLEKNNEDEKKNLLV